MGRGAPATPGSARDFAVNVGDIVYFSTDSVDLSPEAAQTLANQAKWLQQYSQYTITIEGHADERGTREYNIALGAASGPDRAQLPGAAGNQCAAHPHHLLRQGASGGGVQRHLLLVAESPRADRAQQPSRRALVDGCRPAGAPRSAHAQPKFGPNDGALSPPIRQTTAGDGVMAYRWAAWGAIAPLVALVQLGAAAQAAEPALALASQSLSVGHPRRFPSLGRRSCVFQRRQCGARRPRPQGACRTGRLADAPSRRARHRRRPRRRRGRRQFHPLRASCRSRAPAPDRIGRRARAHSHRRLWPSASRSPPAPTLSAARRTGAR